MISNNIDNEEDDNKANEPTIGYRSKKMRFFSSFEEMNDADAMEMAALSGVQHLQNVTWFVERLYADELKNKVMDRKIHFIIKNLL